jgi:hypothetical protein
MIPSISESGRHGSKWNKKPQARESIVATTTIIADTARKLQGQATASVEQDSKNNEEIRVLVSYMPPKKIDTRNNVASLLLGQYWGEKVLDFFVYKGLRARLLSIVITLMWAAGQSIGILSLFGVLPSYYGILGGILTLPCLIINCYFNLILDVLKMLLKKFDTIYMIYNILGVTVSLSLILGDGRAVFVLTGFLVSGLWTTLSDAMPTGMRRITQITGMGFALTIYFVLQVGLYSNLIHVEEAR